MSGVINADSLKLTMAEIFTLWKSLKYKNQGLKTFSRGSEVKHLSVDIIIIIIDYLCNPMTFARMTMNKLSHHNN